MRNVNPLDSPALDQLIEAKRAELRQLDQTEDKVRSDLYLLFQQKAEAVWPSEVGTNIEYAPGKFGRVDRIGFSLKCLSDLDSDTEVHWMVSGRKLDRFGVAGTRDFSYLGPATHNIARLSEGARFTPKHLSSLWGVNDEEL